ERFAALPCCRADQYYMTSGALGFHLRHAIFHQPKKTVNINGKSRTPLLIRHLVDGNVLRRPDSVVSYDDVQFAEVLDGCIDQRLCRFCCREIGLDRNALFYATALPAK